MPGARWQMYECRKDRTHFKNERLPDLPRELWYDYERAIADAEAAEASGQAPGTASTE